MAIFRCKMCGSDLDVLDGQTTVRCEACDTVQTLPKLQDESVQNLFNRANSLRIKCEFDKAEQIYEKILQIDNTEAEAHWGIVLCKYGIEYVEDPKTYRRIPTCHRTSFEAVTADGDYLAALQYSDVVQRKLYEEEARAIDRLQKGILDIVRNEKPFDVFICYKETDQYGKRTVDSAIANDIYHQLTQEGLKVFYAAITLEDKLGTAYEPYIFAALNSAKVMLVIGTRPEYFTAVWVKNEWSRFLKLMKSNPGKLLIPCYRDMDAYAALPDEFAHLQAQDMGKIGFINDLVRGIRKVIPRQETAAPAAPAAPRTEGGGTAPLLKRAFLFLEDGDWRAADEYCEKVLDLDPENARAYLGKLMAELHVYKQRDLEDCKTPFDGNGHYKKALRYADPALAAALQGYNDHIRKRNENAHLDGIYTEAMRNMNAARSRSSGGHSRQASQNYREAAELFKKISSYKDAGALADICREEALDILYRMGREKLENAKSNVDCDEAAELLREASGYKDADGLRQQAIRKSKELFNEDAYLQAKYNMERGRVSDLRAAERLLERIAGYKDADDLRRECRDRIEEIQRQERAAAEEKACKEAEAKAEQERAWQEHVKREKAARTARKLIVAVLSLAVIAGLVIYVAFILPGQIEEKNAAAYAQAEAFYDSGDFEAAYPIFQELGDYQDSAERYSDALYNHALALYGSRDYQAALTAFETLGGYQDSADYLDRLPGLILAEPYRQAEVGDTVTMGAYREEPMEWTVLDKQEGKLLLLSKEYIFDIGVSRDFHDYTMAEPVWETCTLREHLNDDLLYRIFSEEEQKLVLLSEITTEANPEFGTTGGADTLDKLFILSYEEVMRYLPEPGDREYSGVKWWLRTTGKSLGGVAYVNKDGTIDLSGTAAIQFSGDGPRPRIAMWIDISEPTAG